MGDEINWAKWRYQIRRKNERRRNRTPEQKFEHEQLRLESQRRKIIREFDVRSLIANNLIVKDLKNKFDMLKMLEKGLQAIGDQLGKLILI